MSYLLLHQSNFQVPGSSFFIQDISSQFITSSCLRHHMETQFTYWLTYWLEWFISKHRACSNSLAVTWCCLWTQLWLYSNLAGVSSLYGFVYGHNCGCILVLQVYHHYMVLFMDTTVFLFRSCRYSSVMDTTVVLVVFCRCGCYGHNCSSGGTI